MCPKLRGAAAIVALTILAGAARGDDAARDRRRTPVVDVFQRCKDAVVNISTTRVVPMHSLYGSLFDDIFDLGRPAPRERVQSVGSGIVIHEDGFIVTNAHVVSQATDVRVTFADKSTLPAEIVAVDPEHDLAILRVKADHPLPFQKLGASHDVMVGETVVAIGNPLGLQHTVTAGIVSALDRDLQFNNDVTYRGLIQTDAPINPGNSGGPLLNVNGDLIGINSAIRGDAQNIGFAIPVDRLWELVPEMLDIERRQRVRFGLRVSGPDAEVTWVRPDSAAAKAGLKPGERVTELNGHKLRNGIDFYVRLLDQKPDTEVQLALRRDGRTTEVAVPLQSVPLPDGRALASRLFGITLGDVPAELRRQYDLTDAAGLMVEKVEAGGTADRAGIHAGDLILRLNRVPVAALKDVGLTLEQVRPGERVAVEGLRLRADPPFFWSVALRAAGGR